MAGYTRQSTYTDGDIIQAADSNDEFDQLLAAFNNATGHAHDGTAAEGPVIGLIGDPGIVTPLNKVVVNDTSNQVEFSIDVSSVSTQQFLVKDGVIQPTSNNDIDLGTSSFKFKNGYFAGDLTVDGDITLGGDITIGDADTDSITVNADVDSHLIPNTDDTYDLGSASKEWRNLYIDGTANIDTASVDTANITTLTATGTSTLSTVDINGGNIDGTVIGATTAAAGDFTTVNSSGAMIATGGFQGTLTGAVIGNVTGNITSSGTSTFSTVDINGGAIDGTAIGANSASTGAFTTLTIGGSTGITSVDNDISSVSASDDTLASAKAIKTYIDAQVTAQDLDFEADSGGALSIDLDSETLTIAGGTGIDTTGSGNTVTVDIDSTVATLTGTQTLTNKTIDSASNTLTVDLSEATVTGTTAEFNSALSDDSFATLTNTVTLTNKTIDSASNTLTLDLSEGTLTGTTAEFNTALSDDNFATISGTETLTNKTLTSPTIDLSTVTSSGDLAVADGGTGASTAAAARTNLDVDQAGTALALAIALG